MLGLAVLAYALRGRPGGTLALIVAVAYAVGGTLWLANLAVRLSATPWAANELVATGVIPPAYTPWRIFNGLLFAAFSTIPYGSVTGLGGVILRSTVAPVWTGWLFIVWGLSAGFVVGATVPFIAYVPLVLLGAFLVKGTG